jgi:hypothetical protein
VWASRAQAAAALASATTAAGKSDADAQQQQRPASQARQVWEAMQLNQVWRPMVFICVFALAPGNGDAFNSFLLSDPDELAGGDWPGGIAPLNFSDSDFAYVGTIAAAANVLGTWIFRRYLRTVVRRTHALDIYIYIYIYI